MDGDEQLLIDRLNSLDVSDADISSCIDSLEMLLLVESIPFLVDFLGNENRPYELREQAARAIHAIGAPCSVAKLKDMAAEPRFQKLALIAIHGR